MTVFLPIELGDATSPEKLLPGAIAYSPSFGAWFLAAKAEDAPAAVILSGPDAPQFYLGHLREDESVFSVAGCRLEIDPTSAEDGRFADAPIGHAYLADGRTGIFGKRTSGPFVHRGVPFDLTGSTAPLGHNSHKVFFSSWRIVVGGEDRPFVISEHTRQTGK